MKIQTIIASLLIASAVTPAFARPSTGVSECDKMLNLMESCAAKEAKNDQEREQVGAIIDLLQTALQTSIDKGETTKADAKAACLESIEELRKEGCK